MKTLILVVACAIVATALVSLVCCDVSTKPKRQAVSVLLDVTEKYMTHPVFNDIASISYIPFKASVPDHGYAEHIRFVQISEFSVSRLWEVSIGGVSHELLMEKPVRTRDKKEYQKDIETVLHENLNARYDRSGTALYTTMVTELNQLAMSDDDSKIMLIYSDLMERSKVMNFYAEYNNLREQREVLVEHLMAKYPLHSLKGITVYIVHTPVSLDLEFTEATDFITDILTRAGANVIITSKPTRNHIANN